MKPVRVGLVGSQFVSTIHAEALKRVPGAELFAVTSPTGAAPVRVALTRFRHLVMMGKGSGSASTAGARFLA